ncbi:MAG: hypothetical protein R3245_08755 [Kiloniellales bacterium]|nr:hypothetical protein [Kiloniellales bacterium]
MAIWSILVIGFLVGLRHALEADHVAAVSTLVAGKPDAGRALSLGLSWGAGHAITLLLVAPIILMTGGAISETLAHWLEGIVGFLLIYLGVSLIYRLVKDRVHFHRHSHGEVVHFHAHSHAGEGAHHASPHDHEHKGVIAKPPFLIGMMHGLSGSAALVLLAVGAFDSLALCLLYIAVFGLGSILGMGLLSCVISLPLRFAARNLTWGYRAMNGLLGGATASLGLMLVIENLI